MSGNPPSTDQLREPVLVDNPWLAITTQQTSVSWNLSLTSRLSIQVKTHELREKTKADLTKQLEELKQELSSLRVQKVAGGAPAKLAKM